MPEEKDSATPTSLNPNDLLTPQERVARFNDEFKALLGKYELGLTAEAYVQAGQVLAAPKVIDNREKKPEVSDTEAIK
jgi:hypothetical protein